MDGSFEFEAAPAAAAFALWLSGPLWLLLGAGIVTAILRRQDHIV